MGCGLSLFMMLYNGYTIIIITGWKPNVLSAERSLCGGLIAMKDGGLCILLPQQNELM